MTFTIPSASEDVPREYTELLDEIDRLAERLDRQFQIPMTRVRFGWDPVIGFIPIAGDIVTVALALKIILAARKLGADRALLRRMAANTAIDATFGLIPIAGTVFDLFYRANVRNVALLMEAIRTQRGP
jgi:hypothetical protein